MRCQETQELGRGECTTRWLHPCSQSRKSRAGGFLPGGRKASIAGAGCTLAWSGHLAWRHEATPRWQEPTLSAHASRETQLDAMGASAPELPPPPPGQAFLYPQVARAPGLQRVCLTAVSSRPVHGAASVAPSPISVSMASLELVCGPRSWLPPAPSTQPPAPCQPQSFAPAGMAQAPEFAPISPSPTASHHRNWRSRPCPTPQETLTLPQVLPFFLGHHYTCPSQPNYFPLPPKLGPSHWEALLALPRPPLHLSTTSSRSPRSRVAARVHYGHDGQAEPPAPLGTCHPYPTSSLHALRGWSAPPASASLSLASLGSPPNPHCTGPC